MASKPLLVAEVGASFFVFTEPDDAALVSIVAIDKLLRIVTVLEAYSLLLGVVVHLWRYLDFILHPASANIIKPLAYNL